jgi:Subtilase family
VPHVITVRVDRGQNQPSTRDSAEGEVILDIEVAAAVAPKAKIAVYLAPNTDKGFLDAITMAIHDTANKPSIISIGWGGPESNWTAQAMNSYDQALQTAAALGVTVCCAAGDNGSGDGVGDGMAHVDFPASSPFALGCGGTKLTANGGTISSEIVWNESADSATGGGVSDFFALPAYQSTAGVPASANAGGRRGRGVPDVAANADPAIMAQRPRLPRFRTTIAPPTTDPPTASQLPAATGVMAGRLQTHAHKKPTRRPAVFAQLGERPNQGVESVGRIAHGLAIECARGAGRRQCRAVPVDDGADAPRRA